MTVHISHLLSSIIQIEKSLDDDFSPHDFPVLSFNVEKIQIINKNTKTPITESIILFFVIWFI